MERFEDIAQLTGWDANARIRHGDDDRILALTLDAENHAATRRREFDSVIEELLHHPGYFPAY